MKLRPGSLLAPHLAVIKCRPHTSGAGHEPSKSAPNDSGESPRTAFYRQLWLVK